MATGSTQAAGRLLFVDWLRGWAIVVMIEVHVFNALLRPDLRETGWFHVLNFVNGLVAPSFLFVSGFVFMVASRRRLADLRAFRLAFWRQLKRIGQIWPIAYLLHLPPTPLSQYFTAFRQLDWLAFYKVDVLHCICATWLFLLASLVLIRSERLLKGWLCVASLAFTLLAPAVWSMNLSPPLPTPLAAYFNDRLKSLFPLFPWSGFMLAGAWCASMYSGPSGGDRLIPRLTVAGLWLAFLAALPAHRLAPGYRLQADPIFFFGRLGFVLVLLGACWFASRRREGRTSSFFLTLSRESLFVYVAHIVFLFAPVWAGRSFVQVLDRTHGPAFCAAASAGIIGLMGLAAMIWSRRKQRSSTVK